MIRAWVTSAWRLKLLALGLAILVLAAVAFSQNPPTTRTLTVPLSYAVQPNIVLINPPSQTTVTIAGLADVIAKADASNVVATADATRALPGTARLNVHASVLLPNVGVQQQPPQIAVNVDTYQTATVPVQVNARAAAGWNLDPSKTVTNCGTASVAENRSPCKVVFTGPAAWQTSIKAVTVLQGNLVGIANTPNQPVLLLNAGKPLDLTVRTVPATTVDVTSVDVHTEAVQGSTTAPVALVDSKPSHTPPAGYRITSITINPLSMVMTGDPNVIQRVRQIALPPVDLSNSTSDATFTVPVPCPAGVQCSVATATITYAISKNPNVTSSG